MINLLGNAPALPGYASPSPNTPSVSTTAGVADKSQSVVNDFLAYARMTPAQRMRAHILASLGLTEADLNAMSPKERAAVEKKIEKAVRDAVMRDTEKKTGMLADVTA